MKALCVSQTSNPNSQNQEAAQMEPFGLIHAVTHLIATSSERTLTSHFCAHKQCNSSFRSTRMHPRCLTPSSGITSAEENSQALQPDNQSAICCSRTPAQILHSQLHSLLYPHISFICAQHHLCSITYTALYSLHIR